MAKDKVEIEIKLPITKKVFLEVRKYLQRNARLIGCSEEVDKYYNPTYLNFLKERHPKQYLRLRLKESRSFLTYKYIYFDDDENMTHADEFETEILNAEQLEKIFNRLSCQHFLTINKKRETYHIQDCFAIDLDIVENLGYFIEIESLEDFGGNKKTLDKIYALARKLGLDPSKRNSDGYVLLLMKKKGLTN